MIEYCPQAWFIGAVAIAIYMSTILAAAAYRREVGLKARTLFPRYWNAANDYMTDLNPEIGPYIALVAICAVGWPIHILVYIAMQIIKKVALTKEERVSLTLGVHPDQTKVENL